MSSLESQLFICGICHSTFAKKRLLDIHAKLHINRTKFQCGICTKTFSKKTTYKKHYARLHKFNDVIPQPNIVILEAIETPSQFVDLTQQDNEDVLTVYNRQQLPQSRGVTESASSSATPQNNPIENESVDPEMAKALAMINEASLEVCASWLDDILTDNSPVSPDSPSTSIDTPLQPATPPRPTTPTSGNVRDHSVSYMLNTPPPPKTPAPILCEMDIDLDSFYSPAKLSAQFMDIPIQPESNYNVPTPASIQTQTAPLEKEVTQLCADLTTLTLSKGIQATVKYDNKQTQTNKLDLVHRPTCIVKGRSKVILDPNMTPTRDEPTMDSYHVIMDTNEVDLTIMMEEFAMTLSSD